MSKVKVIAFTCRRTELSLDFCCKCMSDCKISFDQRRANCPMIWAADGQMGLCPGFLH